MREQLPETAADVSKVTVLNFGKLPIKLKGKKKLNILKHGFF